MIEPRRRPPVPSRVLEIERAAAVVGVSPATLRTWAVEGVGPTPYLHGHDGHAVAWTVDSISAWRDRRNKARLRSAAHHATTNPN